MGEPVRWAPSAADGSFSEADRQPLLIVNAVLRRWRVALGVPVLGVLLAMVIALMWPRGYVATAQFLPQVTGDQSRLAGLAAQFGINIGGSASPESPDFYAQLIQSRELTEAVVRSTYRLHRGDSTVYREGRLPELVASGGETPLARLRRGMRWLRKHRAVGVSLKTGVIAVQVTAPQPELAEQINGRILELVNEYNLNRRQTRASAEREFVEGRLRDMHDSLLATEAAYQRFLERNKRYQQSPELMLQAANLRAALDLRRQVYNSLAQSLEQARIDQVRNTPVISVIDRPEGSAVRAPSQLLLAVFLGGMFGLAIALAWVFGGEYIDRQRLRHPETYADFVVLGSALVGRLLPARLAGRRTGGGSSASSS
ncbi:MAG: hypothetical protein HY700_03125 [Gemmatimonadetes bacterium]|nr:hypothetical protein [Gemmatimonadota bacterium]